MKKDEENGKGMEWRKMKKTGGGRDEEGWRKREGEGMKKDEENGIGGMKKDEENGRGKEWRRMKKTGGERKMGVRYEQEIKKEKGKGRKVWTKRKTR